MGQNPGGGCTHWGNAVDQTPLLHVAVARQVGMGSSPKLQTRPETEHAVPFAGGVGGHGDGVPPPVPLPLEPVVDDALAPPDPDSPVDPDPPVPELTLGPQAIAATAAPKMAREKDTRRSMRSEWSLGRFAIAKRSACRDFNPAVSYRAISGMKRALGTPTGSSRSAHSGFGAVAMGAACLAACASKPAPVVTGPSASPGVTRAFGRLKSLEGAWTAYEDGKPSEASVEIVARGTAILQRSGFVAIYSLDGDAILLTVFTDDAIAERLRARGEVARTGGGASIDFELADVANLKSGAGYAEGVTVDFSGDGFAQRWRWRDGAKTSAFEVRFARKVPTR